MGKEIKIGLIAIGVLLIVFGALVYRKLNLHEGAANGAAALSAAGAPTSEGTADKPAVVLAQKDQPTQAAAGGFWNQTGADGSDPAPDAVRPNYMPAESPPVEPALPDRYAPDDAVDAGATATRDAPSDAVADPAAAPSNPFGRRAVAVDDATARGESTPHDSPALELPAQEPALPPVNPLRRLSAQEPVDEATPYEEPEATDDGASIDEAQSPATTEALAPEERPSAEPPRYRAAEEPAHDEASQQPARDEEPRARSDRREAPIEQSETPDAWQAGSPADRPVERSSDPPGLTAGKYTIQPNDSLWIISEKVYGTGGYFKALYEHNRTRLPQPDRLVVGTQIAVPPTTLLEQNYPALCPKQRKSALVKPRGTPSVARSRRMGGADVYVVEAGDTLFDIARYELGKASRWNEIYELNREVLGEDFDHLAPGTELALPPKAQGGEAFTRQDGARIQR